MTYADRQSEHDAAYARAYAEWVASLPPAERAKLEAQGLAAPDTSRKTSTRQADPTILKLAAAPDPAPGAAADSDPQLSTLNSQLSVPTAPSAADTLAAFCARIRAHPNPLLAFDAACFASGLMAIEGLSETALARRHGVTRAAFSKIVVQWSETFGLHPSRGMRSKKAREVYRRARLTFLAQQHERRAA